MRKILCAIIHRLIDYVDPDPHFNALRIIRDHGEFHLYLNGTEVLHVVEYDLHDDSVRRLPILELKAYVDNLEIEGDMIQLRNFEESLQ